MPIYEYRRPDGTTFELRQSFADDPLTHDPETGVEVQRVLHAPAVHFKGSGFYNTDYGTRKRQRENAAAEGSGESGSAGSSSDSSGGDASSSSTGDSSSPSGDKGPAGGDKGSSSGEKAKPGKDSGGSSAAKSKPVATKG
jgi:putative FmdB family regulatory protein